MPQVSSAGRSTPRRFPRISARRPLLVRLLGEQRHFEELSRTRTIGLGGCMFVSPESLGYGSLMEVLISVRGEVARTDGRVVWERERDGHEIEVGVEFLRLSPADRHLLSRLIAVEGSAAQTTAPGSTTRDPEPAA